MQNMEEIEVLAGDSLPEGMLHSAKPVILRGYVANWPLVKMAQQSPKAVMDYLQQYYNQRPVHVMRSDASNKGRLFYNEQLTGFNFSRSREDLIAVFNELSEKLINDEADTLYVGSTAIDHVFPGLREQNDLLPLKNKALISIWMGNQSRIAAHYDAPDNVACVIAGKRRFTLFPPEQTPNLYVGPLEFTPAGQPASLVDFHQPDFEKYPRFKEALNTALVAELEPGDAIYVPSMWWHHVEGLCNFNILVNYWWRQVENFVGAPADALFHAILSIRDLPEQQRAAWRAMFEHYVFQPQDHSHVPDNSRGILNPLDEDLARQLRGLLINKLNR